MALDEHTEKVLAEVTRREHVAMIAWTENRIAELNTKIAALNRQRDACIETLGRLRAYIEPTTGRPG